MRVLSLTLLHLRGRIGLLVALLGAAGPAGATDIVDVLVRSNELRQQARTEALADSPRAAVLRASWARLESLGLVATMPALRVVQGKLDAEAVMGRTVVASEGLADLPEGERLLVLAHELGHVAMGHWDEQCRLYKRFVPGEVKPETTDPVAQELGGQAHEQAHRHEFAADAYGYRVIRRLGFEPDAAFGLMVRLGAPQDTATHPGTRRRLAQLRMLEADLQRATVQAAVEPGLQAGPDR